MSLKNKKLLVLLLPAVVTIIKIVMNIHAPEVSMCSYELEELKSKHNKELAK